MALHTFIAPLYASSMFANASPLNLTGDFNGGRAAFQAWITRFRDHFRNGDGQGANWNQALPAGWKVSDIARVTQDNDDVYLFEIKNTTLNKSFLFIMGGRNTYDQMARFDTASMFGNTSAGHVWCQNVDAAPANTGNFSAVNPLIVFYNPDPATDDFDMAFTDSVNLTYGTGDFTAPATANLPFNTDAKVNAFLPSHANSQRGFYKATPYPVNNTLHEFMFIINDDPTETGIIFLSSDTSFKTTDSICGLGEYAQSVTPGDTFLSCGFWSYLTHGSTFFGTHPGSFNGYVHGRTSAGVAKHNWNLVCAESLTFGNRKTGGNFIWNRMQVIEGANNKGFISPNIIREIGGFNIPQDFEERYDLGAGVAMVKYTESWALRYAGDVPTFPFLWAGRYIDTP